MSLRTRDVAEAYLSAVARSVSKVRFTDRTGPFRIDYAGGSIGRCSLHRGSHSEMSFVVSGSDEVHMLVPTRSAVEFDETKGAISGRSLRSGLLLPPNSEGRATTLGAFSGISLIAPVGALKDHARKLIDADQKIEIDYGRARAVDLADPVIEALARNMVSVFHELMTIGQKGLKTVAMSQFDELLLGLLTVAASPKVRALIDEAPGEPELAVVRKAQEFIRANSDQPIRLTDLAADLGVGLRSLQYAFQRHVGCSPRDFLMRCRLERARERLTSVEGDETVAAIALEVGFGDLAHFSRSYREAYGELPSTTLKGRRRS